MRRLVVLCLAMGAATAAACGLSRQGVLNDDGPLDGGPDAQGDESTVLPDGAPDLDGAIDAGPDGPCPLGLPGPQMVPATDFCIDSTEVTKAQYGKFLAALPDAGNLDVDGGVKPIAECGYKKTKIDLVPSGFDPTMNPQRPVTKVDWCDAMTYCRWAGKRLCGKRGGGALDKNAKPNDTVSQWYTACSQGGLRTWCYGAKWDPKTCRTDDNGQKATDVATYPNCVGGYPGLFDLTGNVGEWIDRCDGPASNDPCDIQGGDYGTNDTSSQCDGVDTRDRDTATEDWIGFRCCN